MAIQSSRRQRRLVLTFIASILLSLCILPTSCGEGKGKTEANRSLPMDSVEVKKLYTTKCAICHGYNGKMAYAGAKDITLSTLTKEETAAQIRNGKGTMPPQGKVLTDEQINALADYTLSLRDH